MAKIDIYSGLKIIENKEDLQNFYDTNKRHESGVVIKLFDDKTNQLKNFDLLDIIASDVVGFQKCGLSYVNLLVPYERMRKDDFSHINNFWNAIKGKINCNVCVNHKLLEEGGFYEDQKQLKWHVKTIIKANSEIDRVCKVIKDSKLSPFEALAFIHQYVGNVAQYNSSNAEKSPRFAKDQYFAGAYDAMPEVVCMGYASLMKEIIDNLNMPGLSTEIFVTSYFDRDITKYINHARCYIQIKDDKYKLNQSCFCDPTWDGKGKYDLATYTFFAMNNNCHGPEYNSRIIFKQNDKAFILLDRKTFNREMVDYLPRSAEYNKSRGKVDQYAIEKAFFNMKQKTETEKDFDTLMSEIERMTVLSYNHAKKQGFSGYIKSDKTKLSREEAKKIYKENEPCIKNFDNKSTKDEEVCF